MTRSMGRTKQPNIPHGPPAPVSRRQIIGLPAGHLKDASGAAPAAGPRPVLDLPGGSPRTWQLPANRRGQSRTPTNPPTPLITPLTRPRLFRDHYSAAVNVG